MANSKVLPLLTLLEVLGAREFKLLDIDPKDLSMKVFAPLERQSLTHQASDAGCVGLLCPDVTDKATLEQMLTSTFTVGKSTSDFLPLTIFRLSQQVLMQLPSL